MSIADVYSVIGIQLMPRFIMKKTIAMLIKPTILLCYSATTKCGGKMLSSKH
jgi:hypothetical protein